MNFGMFIQFLVSREGPVTVLRLTLIWLCPGRAMYVSDMSPKLIMFRKTILASILATLVTTYQ
jgi:hypothetical protein